MILNRIATKLRKGDWGTVVVEIFVVVIGIFLGLQVDDWNDGRKERQKEFHYLERLEEDLEQDLRSIESSLRAYSDREKMVDFLLDTIENPGLVRTEPSYFIRSIQLAAFTSPPVISDHTYEELKFGGDLTLVRDEALRLNLSRYYAEIERYQEYIFSRETRKLNYGSARRGILTADQIRPIMRLGSRASQTLVFSSEEAWSAYERMIERTTFIEEIPSGGDHSHEIGTYSKWLRMAEDLRAEVKENLGHDRTTP